MKKFYASLVMMLMSVLAFAQTVTVTVVTDNPEAMYVVDPYDYQPMVWDENNSVTVQLDKDDWDTLGLNAYTGYYITSVTNQEGTSFCYYPTSRVSIYSYNYNDGDVFTCTTQAREPKSLVCKADPKMVYLSIDYGSSTLNGEDQVDGAWTLDITDDTQISIKAYDGYMITSAATEDGSNYCYYPTTEVYLYGEYLDDGVNIITVDAYNVAESRTSSFILDIIGDPDKVTVRRYNIYDDITLTGNITEIAFNPAQELPITISPAVYGNNLYKVTLNDAIVEGSSSFAVYPENGDTVKVYTEFPDYDVPVKFTFVNEGTEESISVTDNGVTVAPEVWSADDFTVKLGHKLTINFNTNAYTFNSIYQNGTTQISTWSSYYEVTLTKEEGYTFDITATPIPTYSVTVNCDDPSHIQAYIGNYNYSNVTTFTEKTTVLKVSQTSNSIRFLPTATGVITGVTTSTGDEITDLTQFTITVTGDMTIDFTTGEFSRPYHGMLYLAEGNSTVAYAEYGWISRFFGTPYSLYSSPHKWEMVPEVGYNEFDYSDEDLPFQLDMYPNPVVYYKNEKIELTTSYPYEYTALYDFKDGDVLKVYPTEVEALTITNEIQEGLTVKFTTDYLTEEQDNAATISVLPGTYYTIEPVAEDGTEYVVTVNDVEATAVEGVYSAYITEDTNVIVSAKTAIKLAGADTANAQDVYNLQGILVKKAANTNDIKALPAGLYIIGGKKYIVR